MKKIILLSVLAVVLCGLAVTGIYKQYRRAQVAAQVACLDSIRAALFKNGIKPAIEPKPADGWVFLRGEDYRRTIELVSMETTLVCGPSKGKLVDAWNHDFGIGVRKLPNGAWDYYVWSNGPDGLDQTVDDIYSTSFHRL